MNMVPSVTVAAAASLLVTVLLVSLPTASDAVQCYVCVGCNDPFDTANSSHVVDCPSVNHCQKVKAASVVTRSCGSGVMTGCKSMLTVSTCECSGDLCNGVAPLAASTGLIGLVLTLLAASFVVLAAVGPAYASV